MSIKPNNLNSEVTDFLNEPSHSLRKEIEYLRICILSANDNLTENIKWNGPNYCFEGEDRITMRIQPPTTKQIQIIFHCGAKRQIQPNDKLIVENSKLLIWKENDRAIATFTNMNQIVNAQTDLKEIIQKWLTATK